MNWMPQLRRHRRGRRGGKMIGRCCRGWIVVLEEGMLRWSVRRKERLDAVGGVLEI